MKDTKKVILKNYVCMQTLFLSLTLNPTLLTRCSTIKKYSWMAALHALVAAVCWVNSLQKNLEADQRWPALCQHYTNTLLWTMWSSICRLWMRTGSCFGLRYRAPLVLPEMSCSFWSSYWSNTRRAFNHQISDEFGHTWPKTGHPIRKLKETRQWTVLPITGQESKLG